MEEKGELAQTLADLNLAISRSRQGKTNGTATEEADAVDDEDDLEDGVDVGAGVDEEEGDVDVEDDIHEEEQEQNLKNEHEEEVEKEQQSGKEQASAPTTNQNPVWSWKTTFLQRQLNMLRFGFFSDFTVLLGGGKQKVLVHKAVLASASLVLYNEVLKVLSEGVNVLELDDEPRIFTLFLQYLYTGQSGVGFKEAFSLQKLAMKYQIPDLVKQCEDVISSQQFTLDNAFTLLPLAINSSHETLLAALLNFVCKNGTVFIKDKRFCTLSEALVLEILKRDDLAVKHEMEVLSAVVYWGQHQCRLQNIDEKNPANFGPLIIGFLRHVRFPCDFAPKFWLPYLEKVGASSTNQILKDIFSPRHHFNPYNKTVRRYSEPMCLVHSRYSGEGGNTPLMPWRCKNPQAKVKETLMFLVNFPFTFFGFSLVKGIFGENFEKNIYDYSELIIQTTIATGQSVTPTVEIDFGAEPKKELRVHFESPIDIPAHKWITLVIMFSGNLKFKAKNSNGGFQKLMISNCQLHVGTGMTSDHNTTLIPMEVKMILPIMCEFRRATVSADQLPIDKGYIESLLFSLNRPHPQGKDTSREQITHTPFLCSFE